MGERREEGKVGGSVKKKKKVRMKTKRKREKRAKTKNKEAALSSHDP